MTPYSQHSVDDVDAIFSPSPDWEFEITQLRGGRLGYHATSITLPDMTLTWERLDRPIRSIQHWQLRGLFCGFVLKADGPIWSKGRMATPDTPLIFGSDTQDTVLPAGCSIMTMELHESRALSTGLIGLEPGLWHSTPATLHRFTSFCASLAPKLRPDPHRPLPSLAEQGAWVQTALDLFLGSLVEPVHAPVSRKYDMIRRADDFVSRTGLSEDICIDAMADAIGASRRTMHRAFKDLFGVGPKGYLRLVRLHRFRQSLLQGPDACVTDAALDAGLGHFGRAARYYREQFGELPRDTLERTAQTRTLSPTP